MNTLELKADWNIIKGRLKQRFDKLTENDLQYTEGQEDELLGRIQRRTGATRRAVEHIIEKCRRNQARMQNPAAVSEEWMQPPNPARAAFSRF